MKFFPVALVSLLAGLAWVGAPDVAGAQRTGAELIPLSPSLTAECVLAPNEFESKVKFTVSGAPGAPFAFAYVVRDALGNLLLDEESRPLVGVVTGVYVGPTGTWSFELPTTALAAVGVDFTLEAAAAPTGPYREPGCFLSWSLQFQRQETGLETAAPSINTSMVTVPGVVGSFPSTQMVLNDPGFLDGVHLMVLTSGPAGMYPIG
ncbi:MAG TPA: hypothetical protein VEI02_04965 [Planctomycetota bacterium]|nr:hypothetical protein [Planctomycetota bacterium]